MFMIADFLYFVTYYIIKYRRAVVEKNLEISFPNISKKDRKRIIKKFYKNFSDVLIESLMAISLSKEELKQRVSYSNKHLVEDCKTRGFSSVFLATHQCNWEWMHLTGTFQFSYQIVGIYKSLKSDSFGNLMLMVRSRFGGDMVSSDRIVRNIAKNKNEIRGIGLIGDQRPHIGEKKIWVKMFGHDTAFHTGVEFIPKMENAAVFIPHMTRKGRGRYHIDMIKLCEPPYNKERPTEIIEKYASELESIIKKHPSDWLWSHDRWKYTKKEAEPWDKNFEK